MTVLDCFSASYGEARDKFLGACADAESDATVSLQSIPHPLAGPNGQALFTDVAVIGDPEANKALVLISGTHGNEGPCGSGCQIAWLRSGRHRELPSRCKLVLVHAINPHGYAHVRRVTEDNVDLNRNFVDHGARYPENPAYAGVHDLMLPAEWTTQARARADEGLRAHADAHGEFALQEAITRGQHSHPDGLFFGGLAPTWSNRTIRRVLAELVAPADVVGLIDYHTGLGPYGTADLITEALPGSDEYRLLEAWYQNGISSPEAGNSTSATLTGTLFDAVRDAFPDARLALIAAEFGTYDFRRVINALRGDHWLHANGTADPDLRQAIKAEIGKALYPDENDWKELVALRGRQLIDRAVAGLAAA